ncbi:MAG: nucleotidyltransferase family protein [Eubacterium sp.]|nr:nucleotidyltransferase family protein [Eubacterium sp.]
MVIGIVCEFNPFHQGHQHLIRTVKKDGDAVICAMSGNFVQRGEMAVTDKFTRTKAALEGGADLVIEIPTVCATRSAGGFAEAGVQLLEATGLCDALAFGAECDDVTALQALASTLNEQDGAVKAAMAQGLSYPAARKAVIPSPLLDTPNNLLAIEYLRCTKLQPIAVKRIGKGHDSDDPAYSASAIRAGMDDRTIASLRHCESAVLYQLRKMNEADFALIEDVSEGLENRIVQAVKTARSLEELYALIKTKRYTHSRIRRIILRAFLGITAASEKQPQYLRILGFSVKGKELLPALKNTAVLPTVAKYSDAKALGGKALAQFEQESRFTDIYSLGFCPPRPCGLEKSSPLVILE